MESLFMTFTKPGMKPKNSMIFGFGGPHIEQYTLEAI